MFKNILIMSYDLAEAYGNLISAHEMIVISLNNHGDHAPNFERARNVLDVLELFVMDTQDPEYGMTSNDAERIVSFVREWERYDCDIVVHCSAGISRSPGVAAALGRILNGDERFVFDSVRYAPSFLCYSRVLDAAGIPYDAEFERMRFGEQLERRRAHLKERFEHFE